MVATSWPYFCGCNTFWCRCRRRGEGDMGGGGPAGCFAAFIFFFLFCCDIANAPLLVCDFSAVLFWWVV